VAKKIKTSVAMPPDLVAALTMEAREFGCSRSQLITRILNNRHKVEMVLNAEEFQKFQNVHPGDVFKVQAVCGENAMIFHLIDERD
jgi:hypothetical protein